MGDPNKGENGTAFDHWIDRITEFMRQMNFDGQLGKEVDLMSRFKSDTYRKEYRKESFGRMGKYLTCKQNKPALPRMAHAQGA